MSLHTSQHFSYNSSNLLAHHFFAIPRVLSYWESTLFVCSRITPCINNRLHGTIKLKGTKDDVSRTFKHYLESRLQSAFFPFEANNISIFSCSTSNCIKMKWPEENIDLHVHLLVISAHVWHSLKKCVSMGGLPSDKIVVAMIWISAPFLNATFNTWSSNVAKGVRFWKLSLFTCRVVIATFNLFDVYYHLSFCLFFVKFNTYWKAIYQQLKYLLR